MGEAPITLICGSLHDDSCWLYKLGFVASHNIAEAFQRRVPHDTCQDKISFITILNYYAYNQLRTEALLW